MRGKAILASVFAMATLAIAQPASAGVGDYLLGAWQYDVHTADDLEANRIAFMNGLYDGYQSLSEDRDVNFDMTDGEHFNFKARTAARGSVVDPDELMDRELQDSDAAELQAARDRLYRAYNRGGRTLAPAEAAAAQVSFDCWIEAAERDAWVPLIPPEELPEGQEVEYVRPCWAAFGDAISQLENSANLALTEMAMMEQAAPAMAPAPAAAPRPYVVYFGFDRSDISAAAAQVIDQAVADAQRQGISNFTVTGHADRSGAGDYNQQLSLARSNAVRDALVSRGVAAGNVSVAGRGEAESAVPTADGVREPANRRVEIVLL